MAQSLSSKDFDEETKLLSLTNISDIWVEETFECSYDIVSQLNLRMRGNAENQQLYLCKRI